MLLRTDHFVNMNPFIMSLVLVILCANRSNCAKKPLIKEEQCIDPNEFYRIGISPCGSLCENINRLCDSDISTIDGCDCIDGYARLKPTEKCIRINDRRCQAAASRCDYPHEHYKVGISPCGNTCANYGKLCNKTTTVPIEGCDCLTGYARLQRICVNIDSKECRSEYTA